MYARQDGCNVFVLSEISLPYDAVFTFIGFTVLYTNILCSLLPNKDYSSTKELVYHVFLKCSWKADFNLA